MSRTTGDADRSAWTVRRRWAPRLGSRSVWQRVRRRLRQTRERGKHLADIDTGCLEVVGEGAAVAAVVIVAVVFLIFVGLPLIVAAIELVLIVVVIGAGVVARVLLRRPWIIEARNEDGTVLWWRVRGWRNSTQRRASSSSPQTRSRSSAR